MNLILVRGLPGSGKTTTALRIGEGLQFDNWLHFEADMFFIDKNGDYKWDRSKIREAHAWCQEQTVQAMARNYTVIVSNTFTTKKELRPYFDIAEEYGILPTVILCQNDWGSVHNVPPETMAAMKQRFQYDISDMFKVD
jgi:predicted kinase